RRVRVFAMVFAECCNETSMVKSDLGCLSLRGFACSRRSHFVDTCHETSSGRAPRLRQSTSRSRALGDEGWAYQRVRTTTVGWGVARGASAVTTGAAVAGLVVDAAIGGAAVAGFAVADAAIVGATAVGAVLVGAGAAVAGVAIDGVTVGAALVD